MTQDAPVSHLLLHPGRNINQPVAFVPGVSCSSPLTLCHTSMWLTVYSFRCMAFLISPCFHPLPPPFAYSHLDLPVSLLADQMHPEWNRPARREGGGSEKRRLLWVIIQIYFWQALEAWALQWSNLFWWYRTLKLANWWKSPCDLFNQPTWICCCA